MSPANRNLLIRLATAVVMVPLMLAMMYVLPKLVFYGLIVLATVVGALEFFKMTHPGDRFAQGWGVLVSLAISFGLYFKGDDNRVLAAIVMLVPMQAVILSLVRLGDVPSAALRMTASAFGPIYMAGLTVVAMLHKEQGNDGGHFVVLTLMLAWFGDTGGYFAGRFLGKHKLYPAVSPAKTWEGAAGGIAASLFGALLAHFWYLPRLPLWAALLLGTVGSAIGILGDLGESLLKRSTGIKDSGAIVPGHGGILDRVDAVVMIAPLVYLYTKLG